MRVMGLDVGTKRIGVALSDPMGLIAQGRENVARTSDQKAIDQIKKFVEDNKVKKIIVGHPINMNGTIGERARDSEDFAEKLKKRIKVPVLLWDERLSTKEAERVMLKADLSRKKRKMVVDSIAAQIILQNYLDYVQETSAE